MVYNHFGPVGNYTNKFGPYLTDSHHTPWGDAVNLNEGGSDEVRRFFCDNALMWLRDYHCDGLRFDAVHEFIDRSAVHFMEQLSTEVERLGATLGREFYPDRRERPERSAGRPSARGHGYGMDSQWSDDFHHALFTLLYTKEQGRGYYDDFGTMDDLHKALKHAYVYDGQYSGYRKHKHGRPGEGLSAHHFVHFDQNHDQVGNRAMGERLEHLVGLDAAKVAIGLVLTAPYVPMLFMGEEYAASTPFLYFADHEDEEMRKQVAEGRKREFGDFGFDGRSSQSRGSRDLRALQAQLDEVHEGKHAEMLEWTKDLIKLRRSRVALNDGSMQHLLVSTDDARRTLVMLRDEVRVVVNFGTEDYTVDLLEEECLRASSRAGLAAQSNKLQLPPMTLAVLTSTTEQAEDREVG